MTALRLSIVRHAGWYHLMGPITHQAIYRAQTMERVEHVRDLFLNSGLAWHLLDPSDASRDFEIFDDPDF